MGDNEYWFFAEKLDLQAILYNIKMYIYNGENKSLGQNYQQLSNFDILLKQLLKTGLMYTPGSCTIYLVLLYFFN